MKENEIIVIINRPIKEVFEFTTNPKNTPLWIESIEKEIAGEYPPKIGTIYQNKSKDADWNFYKVIEFEDDRVFTLSDLEGNYFVRYSYGALGENKTKMEYFEWVKNGDLEKPFTKDILEKLKRVLEKE